MSALEAVGKSVVLRGLRADDRFPGTAISPRIGFVVRALHEGAVYVKLRIGTGKAGRWCPKGRIVELGNVARQATRRELALNMVCDPLPAVVS